MLTLLQKQKNYISPHKAKAIVPHLLLSQAYLPPPKLNDFLAKNFGKQKTLAKFDTYSQ